MVTPNGLRISGERGGEADERVRCMRVLGDAFSHDCWTHDASHGCLLDLAQSRTRANAQLFRLHDDTSLQHPAGKPWSGRSRSVPSFLPTRRLTGSASAASEEPKAMSESAACAC